MNIAQYRLAKITYDYNLKDFIKIKKILYSEDDGFIQSVLNENISNSIHKRNHIVDWIWLIEKDLNRLISILDKNNIRYSIVDHTDTYLFHPEKLSTLREEIDKRITEFINMDFVLDRITEVGIEKLSKLEKKFLNENHKNI